MELVWITDPHLNFLSKKDRKAFYDTITGDVIVISGDIAEAPSYAVIIKEMQRHLKLPVYFVLGNHDYYDGMTVAEEHKKLRRMWSLKWLPKLDPVNLKDKIYLTGIDGWADMRNGMLKLGSPIMNDHFLIKDFKRRNPEYTRRRLADADAETLSSKIEQAADKGAKEIYVITHIPPFSQSAQHWGVPSGPEYQIYYSSKATGDILLEKANKYPNLKLTVLCGHSHSEALYVPLPNLTVKTGGAQYYNPKYQTITL